MVPSGTMKFERLRPRMISTQRQDRKHTSPNPFFDFALAPEITGDVRIGP
jgi:hypothetical protein